ncbi:hypothetical protein [Pseudomonas phage PIP]|nr:hypothetical protein [Pseudomonas phage PIP]
MSAGTSRPGCQCAVRYPPQRSRSIVTLSACAVIGRQLVRLRPQGIRIIVPCVGAQRALNLVGAALRSASGSLSFSGLDRKVRIGLTSTELPLAESGLPCPDSGRVASVTLTRADPRLFADCVPVHHRQDTHSPAVGLA